MAYVTLANLTTRWPSLMKWTDDDASGAIDSTVVTAAIADAAASIDLAAAQQYTTPLSLGTSATAAFIQSLAEVLAGHYLAERVNDLATLDAMRDSYDDAIEFLKRLSAGKEALPGESQAARSLPAGNLVMYGDTSPITDSNLWGL